MEYVDFFQFGVGALLGLSAAPHCLVMCSGVASALALAGGGKTAVARSEVIARGVTSNTGRIASYAIAGTIVGALGVAAFSWLDASLANITLRWLAAILLSVVGLSLAGIMPAFAVGYPGRAIAKAIGKARCGGCARSYSAVFFAGTIWGFIPCAMAYSALFYATISGSAVRGAMVMAGFGLATAIPMMLPAFGISALSRFGMQARMRPVFGVVLAAVGIVGTLNAVHDFGVWCRT